ncbi:hypothetical protein FOA43_004730 [Brettanomyces nanus]|uniref:2-dehydropantoate 2-reductase n=1 Tax=Eeniella nana TaxID=13502 RepID=A0A875S6W8_EENNA|nr:uncharacterized protein FOA43_004730 [Brettanomyces nanus]QPG77321.1 hypothetical protein FOA43_004730 [Brettanomyces nanus]
MNSPIYDFLVITTKNLPDIVKLEDVTQPVITPGRTTVVLIQNGFDIGRPFITKYPKNICLSGISHIGSHNDGGVITQSQHDRCLISYFENPILPSLDQKNKAEEFISLYSNEKNSVSYVADAKRNRYEKLVYNATMNTACALTGVDAGRLETSGALDTVAVPAMREVVQVAKADGVELPEDIINTFVHSDDGYWFEPSMRVDVKKGNPIELEVILGNLLRVARELKVETPHLELMYNLLKAVQFRLKEAKGMIHLPEKRPISDRFYK